MIIASATKTKRAETCEERKEKVFFRVAHDPHARNHIHTAGEFNVIDARSTASENYHSVSGFFFFFSPFSFVYCFVGVRVIRVISQFHFQQLHRQ